MSHKFEGMWTKVHDPAAQDNMLIGRLDYNDDGVDAPPEVTLIQTGQIIPFYNQVYSVMNGNQGRLDGARQVLDNLHEFAKLFDDGKAPDVEQWNKIRDQLAAWRGQ